MAETPDGRLREVATLLRLCADDFDGVADEWEALSADEVVGRLQQAAQQTVTAVSTVFGWVDGPG